MSSRSIHERIADSRDRALYRSHRGRVSVIADRPPVRVPHEGDSQREHVYHWSFVAVWKMIHRVLERISQTRRLKHDKAG